MISQSLLQQWFDTLLHASIVNNQKAVDDVMAQMANRLDQPEPDWIRKAAEILHYPKCWDTAAYPTLDSAIHETLAWSECATCKEAQLEPTVDGWPLYSGLPEPEPELWGCKFNKGNRFDTFYTKAAAERYVEGSLRNGADVSLVGFYTAPPQRKPLTDEEIRIIRNSVALEDELTATEEIQFVRAIEAEHGITGEA